MGFSRKPFRVAVYLDISRQYGREVAMGIADYASTCVHWQMVGGGDITSIANRIRCGRIDGVIARIPDVKTLKLFEHFGIPVVDTYGQNSSCRVSTVECDNVAIARLAMDWFVGRRYTSFAFVGFADTPFSEQRREEIRQLAVRGGYRFASFDMAQETREKMVRTTLVAESLGAAPDEPKLMSFLLRLPEHTAVFCANDARAYHVLHAAEAGGIPVPERLAVMGVDNDSVLCSLSSPGLTSIDPNARQVGYDAARLLEALMRDGRLGEKSSGGAVTRHRIIAPRCVIERGTTDFDPIGPPWLREAVRHMRKHLGEGINASDSYIHAGMSHTKFERAFRKAIGVSPHEYLSAMRLDDAKRMLRTTKLTVAEIASRTGFSSPQYFNRLFVEKVGVPPGEWREGR